MADPRPPQVCAHCGGLNPDVLQILAEKDEQIAGLERDLRGKRSQISRMTRDRLAELEAGPWGAAALRVLERWRELCMPNAKDIRSGGRLEACVARLRAGYGEAELIRACEGYAARPFIVNRRRVVEGPENARYVDAELIFRDEKHVQVGQGIMDDIERMARSPLAEQPAQNGTTPVELGKFGEAAVAMASRAHWFIFPVEVGGKRPVTPHGLLDATRDVDRIRRFWAANPANNVAIRCGAESGLVVLDVDGDEGMESLRKIEAEFGELPETTLVITPRGGSHYYFQHPGFPVANTAGWPAIAIDIRGDGGYVVAPPSENGNGRAYVAEHIAGLAPMPAWLIEKIQQRAKQAMAPNRLHARDWAKFIQEGAAQGERDNRMTQFVGFAFSRLHGREEPAREVMELAKVLNRNVRPPLSDRDLERIVRSIGRKEARKDDQP